MLTLYLRCDSFAIHDEFDNQFNRFPDSLTTVNGNFSLDSLTIVNGNFGQELSTRPPRGLGLCLPPARSRCQFDIELAIPVLSIIC